MPTVKLNKKVFETLVGKKLPLEKLKDRISMLGTDLDEITEEEIVVEVFPNRPDMLSEQGFARAFSSFIGVKTGLRTYDVKDSKEQVIVEASVSKVRPYTACAIVRGLSLNDEKIREIIQIQEKLHTTYGRNRKKCAIGIYPMEVIKTPITYKALAPDKIRFVPLEGKREMTGTQILGQHPTGKAYAHLLEGERLYPLFVDANDQVLSMPPIINSHTVGKVTESTTDVFIECSGFDFETLSICLNIIVTALADMGGAVYSMELVYPDGKKITPDLKPQEMTVDISYINKRLGLSLSEKEVKELLERMGYGWKGKTLLIPAYRADILHPVDLVEDVAIAYGYENFVAEIPKVSTIAEEAPFEIFKRRMSYLLAGKGYMELNTYNIASRHHQQELMQSEIPLVALANALNEDYDVLRAWMIPALLEVISKNRHHDYPQNIFDIGTVFKKDSSTETKVLEQERLAVATCADDADYTQIRQMLVMVLDHLGLEYTFKETEHASFVPGRVARVCVKGKDVAYIGEIHPQVLANWDIMMPVAAFELNLTELFTFVQ